MFIGHYGLAYAAKRITPRVPLVTLFVAALFLDLLWLFFTTIGSEKYLVNHEAQRLISALVFVSYPYSHSLWSAVLFGLFIGGLYFAWMRLWKDSLVIGLLISSHWLLDFLVHPHSLPLIPWNESNKVGWALWTEGGERFFLAVVLEGLIFLVGLWLSTAQINFRRPKEVPFVEDARLDQNPSPYNKVKAALKKVVTTILTGDGRLVHFVLLTLLLVVFAMSFFPPPQTTIVLSILAVCSFIVPLVLARFVERSEIHEPAFRLSSPLNEIKTHYDVVIVGSGYGGGIAASRFARATTETKTQVSVCVLERGLELHPGEYPRTFVDILRDMRITGQNTGRGEETSLFQLHKNPEMNVLVGCGLGGTSLINANVSLKPDLRVFDEDCWPASIRQDAQRDGPLQAAYDKTLHVLKARAYPGLPPLGKVQALQKSAGAFGMSAVYVPVNVAFTDGVNEMGVHQNECVRCGDCFTGCNYNAKTTVLMTYLPDAWKNGAQIFTEVAAIRIRPEKEGGWYVDYEPLNYSRALYGGPPMFVHANLVVLAAGTLGSTEILLRSKADDFALSKQLGEKFSGNGDTAGFTYNAKKRIGAIGRGFLRPNRIEPGPTISAMIDLRRGNDLEKGIIIQDCTIAGGLARAFSFALGMLWTFGRGEAMKPRFVTRVRKLWRWLLGLLPGTALGPLDYTQTYLVVGHDGAVGRLRLGDDDRVRVDWRPDASGEPVFDPIDQKLLEASAALDGTYISNFVRRDVVDVNRISVHPLGGCVMGKDSSAGVVDHKGQVYSCKDGKPDSLHDGLYVLDGSIVPRSLGVNPLLTISALAERNVRLIAEQQNWQIDDSQPTPGGLRPTLPKMRLRFTERMTGSWIKADGTETLDKIKEKFDAFKHNGNQPVWPMDLVLSMESVNPGKMSQSSNLIKYDEVDCRFVGTADVPDQFDPKDPSKGHFLVRNGKFQLFRKDREKPQGLRMHYSMLLVAPKKKKDDQGRKKEDDNRTIYEVAGYKEIHEGTRKDVYEAVTTLYLRIHTTSRDNEGRLHRDKAIGVAVLHLLPIDVLNLFKSMQVLAPTRRGGVRMWFYKKWTLFRFVMTFSKTIFKTYRYLWTILSFRGPGVQRVRRPIRSGTVYHYAFETRDGVWLRLTNVTGPDKGKGPVILAPGFGTSTFAFTLDTVRENLAEFLIRKGHDVWLFDYRASTILKSSKGQFSLDKIALVDWPEAIKFVCKQTGSKKVDVIAHCVGSMSFLMAAAADPDRIVSSMVRRAVCSSLTLFPAAGLWNNLKAWLFTADLLAVLGFRNPSTDFKPYKLIHLLVDGGVRILMIMGVISARERCHNPVCRRILAIYGETHKHSNLDPATHNAIAEMFGRGNVTSFQHLQRILRKRHVVAFNGEDKYISNIKNINFPITFLHGEDNEFFDKSGTRAMADKLKRKATVKTIPHYGHMDLFMGRNADHDVFPTIEEALYP